MKKLWKDDKPLADNLRKVLPKLTADFFKQGQAAATRGTSWHDLHGFRLATKRYRYSLELFAPVYGPGFQVKLELLRGLQRLLGQINDCVTARHLLKGMEGTEATRESLGRRMDRKAAELRRYWKQHFEPGTVLASWTVYFARPSHTISAGGKARK